MMKIEMSVEVDPQFPTGRNPEYLWMIGQPWPVPFGKDVNVNRIEVWGPELDFTKEFENGTEHAEGKLRQWKRPHAEAISKKMRSLTQPEGSAA